MTDEEEIGLNSADAQNDQNGVTNSTEALESFQADKAPFGGGLPSTTTTDELIPWFLFGSGALLGLILFLRRPRKFTDWLIPIGLIGAGLFSLYRRGKTLWNRRAARIRTAQEIIMTELDALDPIARAEVLKFVAERQLGISADADA